MEENNTNITCNSNYSVIITMIIIVPRVLIKPNKKSSFLKSKINLKLTK